MTEPIQNTALQTSKKALYLDAIESDSAMTPTSLGGMMRLAEVISTAKLCPKHLQADPGSVMLVMAASQQLGIPWFAGLQKAYVIDGKVAWEAVVLGAVARRSPRCKAFYLESVTDEQATVVVQTSDMPEPKRVSYTYAQAQKAGLAGKGPWNSYRQNMLVARVTTNVARWYFGDETLGIYTVEELRESPTTPTALPPATGVAEALDRVVAAAKPITQEPPAPTILFADEPDQEPPAPEPAPIRGKRGPKMTAPEPPAENDQEKTWTKLATSILGTSGPGILRAYAKSSFGKGLGDLNEEEQEKLENYLNSIADGQG